MELIPVVGISIWLIAKIFFVIGLLVYLIFAIVVARQVGIMMGTLDLGFETLIKILSYLHLGFAVAVLFLALLIL